MGFLDYINPFDDDFMGIGSPVSFLTGDDEMENALNSAQDSQERSTIRQLEFLKSAQEQARDDLAPQREMFQNVLPQLADLSQQQGPQVPDLSDASLYDFDSDPMYQAMADEMGQRTQMQRAAQGGFNSSRTDDLIARNLVPLMQSSYNRRRQNTLADFDIENTLGNQQYGRMFNLANLGAAGTGSSANMAMQSGGRMAGTEAAGTNALNQLGMQQGQLAMQSSPLNMIGSAGQAALPFALF